MSFKSKVVFLTYIPSPYRVDFFNELSKYCDLHVIYYYSTIDNTPWKNKDKDHSYRKTILFEKSKLQGVILLLRLLFKNRNETIVIGGYYRLAEMIAIFYLKIIGKKFILNSDGGFITKGYFKKKFKRLLIKSAEFWLSSGVNTTNTLAYYGAKPENIFEYHFTSLFEKELLVEVFSSEKLSVLRHQLNLKNEVKYLIFVGQIITRKGADILVDAIPLLKDENIEILLIGEGDDEERLKYLAGSRDLKNKVHFLGKLPKEKVLDYLKVCDIFVFPSREDIWGLVLNEAISVGLPIISTVNVGSAYSLIDNKKNGLIIVSDNVEELAKAINLLLSRDLLGMKKKCLEIAKEYTIENMAIDHMRLFNHFNQNIQRIDTK